MRLHLHPVHYYYTVVVLLLLMLYNLPRTCCGRLCFSGLSLATNLHLDFSRLHIQSWVQWQGERGSVIGACVSARGVVEHCNYAVAVNSSGGDYFS